MTGLPAILLSIAMLAAFGLVIGGVVLIRRGQRRKGVLMIVAAAVLVGNVLIWTVPGRAAAKSLSLPPARAGQCGWVHGRFSVANGSSIQRIWVIGTRRIIALSDYDKSVPPEIRAYERIASEKENWGQDLYGDFHVCALEPSRPGWMQHVRMLRTRNLIFKGKPFRGR
jgi:hypothetical protein